MSGETDSEDSPEWQWAHLLWQKHGIRFEEFAGMERELRLIYMASEQLERESPVNSLNRLAKVYIKTKK